MTFLAFILCFASCKPIPDVPGDTTTDPPGVTLPPGEEWVDGPTADMEALAKSAPLQPGPGTTVLGDNGEVNTPAALRRYEMDVRWHRGETVDMNGNGKPDHYGRWVDGKFTYTIDENEDGKWDEVSDGTTVKTDSNFDGKWDVIETNTHRPTNNGPKLVRERDTDEDGVLDERYTVEYLGPNKRHFMTEKKNAAGAWEVKEDWTGPGYDLMQKKRSDLTDIERRACHAELRQRFPKDLGHPGYETGGVHIPYGGEDSKRCSAPDAARVAKALGCVQKKLRGCLQPLNPGLTRHMDRFLRGAADRHAFISCGGTCPGEIITAPYFIAANGTEIAAVELSQEVLARDDLTLCENVFHELMHAARIPTSPDHDARGDDRVYSCARVCSGCSHWSIGAGDDHKDCAICADDASRKAVCGNKLSVGTALLPDDPQYICSKVADHAVSFAPCVGRHPVLLTYCDGAASPTAAGACCDGCPAGYESAGGGLCSDPLGPGSCQGALWLCNV